MLSKFILFKIIMIYKELVLRPFEVIFSRSTAEKIFCGTLVMTLIFDLELSKTSAMIKYVGEGGA